MDYIASEAATRPMNDEERARAAGTGFVFGPYLRPRGDEEPNWHELRLGYARRRAVLAARAEIPEVIVCPVDEPDEAPYG